MAQTNNFYKTTFRVITRSNVRTRAATVDGEPRYATVTGYTQFLVGGYDRLQEASEVAASESARPGMEGIQFRIMVTPDGWKWKRVIDYVNGYARVSAR